MRGPWPKRYGYHVCAKYMQLKAGASSIYTEAVSSWRVWLGPPGARSMAQAGVCAKVQLKAGASSIYTEASSARSSGCEVHGATMCAKYMQLKAGASSIYTEAVSSWRAGCCCPQPLVTVTKQKMKVDDYHLK